MNKLPLKGFSTPLILAAVVGIIVVLGFGYKFMNSNTSGSNTVTVTPTASSPTTEVSKDEVNIKTFTVEGKPYSFSLLAITVNKGDTVKITFKNMEGFHDFVIDEFNVRTKQIKAGESEEISFVADKTGAFEFYCSVGTHRQMGMKGTLTVQ